MSALTSGADYLDPRFQSYSAFLDVDLKAIHPHDCGSDAPEVIARVYQFLIQLAVAFGSCLAALSMWDDGRAFPKDQRS